MKTLLTITTLVFTLMFSSTSFADWTKVSENDFGDTFYVDFERIRKVDGFVYYWRLTDYHISLGGYVSDKSYYQGDCKLFRSKSLSISAYKKPMGGGFGDVQEPDKDWKYSIPNSNGEIILKSVCSR